MRKQCRACNRLHVRLLSISRCKLAAFSFGLLLLLLLLGEVFKCTLRSERGCIVHIPFQRSAPLGDKVWQEAGGRETMDSRVEVKVGSACGAWSTLDSADVGSTVVEVVGGLSTGVSLNGERGWCVEACLLSEELCLRFRRQSHHTRKAARATATVAPMTMPAMAPWLGVEADEEERELLGPPLGQPESLQSLTVDNTVALVLVSSSDRLTKTVIESSTMTSPSSSFRWPMFW